MHISNYLLFCRRVIGYLFIYFPKETNCFIRCCVPVRVQTVAAGGSANAGGVAPLEDLRPLEELRPLEDCCRWRTTAAGGSAAAGGGSFEDKFINVYGICMLVRLCSLLFLVVVSVVKIG